MTSALAQAPQPERVVGIGHNRPDDDLRSRIIDAFCDILLAERSGDTPCFLDSIFAKAQMAPAEKHGANDVLMRDLFLFEDGRLPLHTNVFNADCGILTEKLIITLFSMTRDDVDASDAAMKALEEEALALHNIKVRTAGKKEAAKTWKKADFLLDKTSIVECKYRFNSYEAKRKQISVAEVYDDLGLKSVFLHLSPDFKPEHDADFKAAGWEVHSGEDAIAYIRDHTGFDLRDLFRDVSARPIMRQRIMDAHRAMIEQQKRSLWRDYYYSPEDIRQDFNTRLAANDRSLTEIAEAIDANPVPDNPLCGDALRQRSQDLTDAAARTLPKDRQNALLGILMSLDENDRAELLSNALASSSDDVRLQVLSIFG